MHSNINLENNLRYSYRIEKVIHRPDEEDLVCCVSEVREPDLTRSRSLATAIFWEEKISLIGKYSPASYSSYDTKKGVGYNCSLILVDSLKKEAYLIESTMEGLGDAISKQREKERQILEDAGFKFPHEISQLLNPKHNRTH